MISGGNATVFVSNMDRAVRFYTEVLGLRLAERYGDHWATVATDHGFTIGLHPASPKYPAPGTKGGIMLGLEVDKPLETVVEQLKTKGVKFTSDVVRDQAGTFANLEDPDGTPIYLWEMAPVPAGAGH
jgi:catechol 2,3-dioxygenase-like lactoylglutathione lyase family enzyme